MNAISQVFKTTQIFKLRKNEQESPASVVQDPGIKDTSDRVIDEQNTTGDRIPNSPPKNLSGSPEFTSKEMPSVWIYDGEAYDLSDFIKKHPGGEFFIGRMKNRDITALVNIFHPNPEKVKKLLKKYALGRKATREDFHPKYNAPPFLFRDDFDGWRDTPKFDFQNKEQLLNKVKARLNQPEMKKKLAEMDFLFDAVTVILFIVYILVQALQLNTQYMPIYLFVPLMAALRISLSGAGHYFNHRAQVRWNKLFAHIFDINYVPMSFVVIDGHSLMHHPYTQSDVDVKQNVFTAMMELPRYYRIPLHTVHKLGHVLTGMFVRTIEMCTYAIKYGVKDFYGSWQRGLPHYVGMISMRILLFAELLLFWLHGDLTAWFAQFILTVWISTFMIVASHDFEEETTDVSEEQDWAVSQIKNSYDLTMVGNKYIDCFLSAGLSPHRVHHVLPYQRSGFANVISEDLVREEAEKFDIVWSQPKNFFIDRLPILVKHYLFGPSRWAKEKNIGLLKEHLHLQALRTSAEYLYKGIVGIGSI
ncbi:cytochrome b5 [Gloeocapsa sp. PCC 7428]|uniref:cytochrome b5 domain-containing protein n=1 Tax=Gloeocapsa sp. PCC 7428 TaxID=1173026 RepID=UPI0002A5DFE5|nr:cytochrome b5-like heme/steroid binding domain-containing protein [Gloeocapsa sp. PCC 7428]AFZ30815.1 cytochrome b5 [Gloeocapsa sp. PCC 7428]